MIRVRGELFVKTWLLLLKLRPPWLVKIENNHTFLYYLLQNSRFIKNNKEVIQSKSLKKVFLRYNEYLLDSDNQLYFMTNNKIVFTNIYIPAFILINNFSTLINLLSLGFTK